MNVRRAESHAPPVDRAALISLITRATRRSDPEQIMEEFAGLAHAAGAQVVLRASQERPSPDPSTFIGSGKAVELARSCEANGATLVLVDNELTPAQTRNLERALGLPVLD